MKHTFSSALSMRALLQRYLRGFTLVELIVVITIIAILSTIGLISFSWFSSGARDSTRVEDLTNMQKSLAIYATASVNGKYPTPDNADPIYNNGVLMNTQGYMGKSQLSTIKFNGAWLDPLDSTPYVYSVNKTQTWFALMAFLENASNLTLTSYLEKSFADTTPDYSKRFPAVTWNPIGVFLMSGSLQPVQSSTSTWYDIGTNTATAFVAYVAPKVTVAGNGGSTFASSVVVATSPAVTSTWITLAPAYVSSTTYTAGQIFSYSGANITVTSSGVGVSTTKALSTCDTNDIVVWAGANIQIWSACNMGASVAGSAASSYGSFYQWGRNDDVTSGAYTAWATGHVSAGEFNSSTLSTGNNLFYGWDATGGEWYFPDVGITPNDRWISNIQGPCPSGYAVPSDGAVGTDYYTASNIIVGTTSPSNGQYDTIRNTLKIPLAGYRSWVNGTTVSQGSLAYYWSTSPVSSKTYYAYFSIGGGTLNANDWRTYGFSVRCIRR